MPTDRLAIALDLLARIEHDAHTLLGGHLPHSFPRPMAVPYAFRGTDKSVHAGLESSLMQLAWACDPANRLLSRIRQLDRSMPVGADRESAGSLIREREGYIAGLRHEVEDRILPEIVRARAGIEAMRRAELAAQP